MKVKYKVININGASPIEEVDTITEFKTLLNELVYYCKDLILNVENNYSQTYNYSETNDIRSIMSDANFYDSVISVHPIF